MANVRKHSKSKSKTDRRPRGDDIVRKRKPSPGPGRHGERTWSSETMGWGAQTETRQERSERLYGVTLRHAVTPGNIAKGNTFKEGPGKGKGKIAGSTVHSGGKHSMRHKYQARIQNELRKTYGARDSIGGSLRKSGHGVHETDVSMNNPPDYR